MDSIKLSVLERMEKGNGPARRLRSAGRIPGVVYGKKDTEATPVSIELESLRDAMAHGRTVVMELDFSGEVPKKGKGKSRHVVVKDMQYHPTKRSLLHVDLYEVDLNVEIESPVPLELQGPAAGEADGGVVDWMHREVIARALPADMPTSLSLDISELMIGDHLTVAALVAPAGVTIVDDPETMVVGVMAPRVVEEEAPEVEGEEGAEPALVGEGGEAAGSGEAPASEEA